MKRRNKEFDKLIINKYNNKQNILSISKELKCSRETIVHILNDNNIHIRKICNNKIQEEEVPNIIDLYINKKKKTKDIGELYKVKNQTIINLLRKNNINIRKRKDYNKYSCNEKFFEKIDTEAKAYFLGLLYADGNVSNKKQTTVRLTLIEEDRHILEQFKKELNYNCPLSYHKSNNKKQKNTFTLYICNYKMKENLINKGCIPKKSLILKFPTLEQVPIDLIHHFIRGYFDGDGCICIKGTPNFSILSTENMINNINIIFNKYTNIGIKIPRLHNNKINREYRISGNIQLKKIYDFLYKNANFYLQRKYNKFQTLLKEDK